MLFAEGEGAVPAFAGGCEQAARGHRVGVDELRGVDADGHDVEVFVIAHAALGGGIFPHIVRGPAMVADHPQHVGAVAFVHREGAQFAGHLGAGGVAFAGQDRADGGADRPAFFAVVRNAGLHQHGAEIGVAQAERAVLIA